MSTSEKYGIAIALFAMALAVVQGMTGTIPPILGWPVVAGCVIAAVALIIRGRRGRNVNERQESSSQETIGKDEAIDERRPSSWKGLSEAEFAQVQAAVVSMNLHHGHADYDGLVDDQKHGRPLNGLCWRCGEPRFQKGGSLK